MGVKLLIRPQAPKGLAGPAQYELLKRLIDDLCVTPLSGRADTWAVTCQLLKQGQGLMGAMGGPAAGASSGGGGLKDVWSVSFRESPDLMYLLIRPECKVLECEAGMARLLEKKLEYNKQMTVRLEGHTYSKGDFLLRLLTATQAIHSSQALLGHVLEVEYLPVSSMVTAEGCMAEMLELLRQMVSASASPGAVGASLELVKPSYDKFGISGMPYGRSHAAVAYCDLVVSLLSASSGAAAAAAAAAAAQQQQQQQQQQGGR